MWQTHIPSDMCSASWETHIPSDVCSPTWEILIASAMGFPMWETHIRSDMFSPTQEMHIRCDMCIVLIMEETIKTTSLTSFFLSSIVFLFSPTISSWRKP